MKYILVPTDFSENAWNALSYAVQFFGKEKVTFHLVHIISTEMFDDSIFSNNDGVADFQKPIFPSEEKMKLVINRIANEHPNKLHNFITSVSTAPFISGIRNYIEKHNIDLIIIGTKGVTGLEETVVGSKSGAIITKVKCTTLVIPEAAEFSIPVNIGLPTDFNLFYKQRIINTLLGIARIHNASIKVLRVAQSDHALDENQDSNRTYLKEHLKNVENSFHVVKSNTLEANLESFVTTLNIDVIAMIAKNLNFFQHVLFRSNGAQQDYYKQVPFLILHE